MIDPECPLLAVSGLESEWILRIVIVRCWEKQTFGFWRLEIVG
jgi:hypothetical protein